MSVDLQTSPHEPERDTRDQREQIGEWSIGLCYGMSGCAWASRGRDPDSWRHFGSLDEARETITTEVERDGR